MNEESLVPKIRFINFNRQWEKRKFKEILTEVKRPIKMNDEDNYELVTVKRRNGGIVSRGIYKGKNVLVKSQFQIKKGDYLISKRQVVHGANGIVPDKLNNSIVSNEYLVSIGNKNITTDFLTILSKLPDMYRKFFLSSHGIDIEKLVFNVSDWKKRSIYIPNLNEQTSISSFFSKLDDLINLQQQLLNDHKQLKKAMLQKMIPQKGENVPRVRFAGFTDDWKKKKLKEIGKTQSGIGFPENEQGGTKGIPFYKVSDMNIKGNENIMEKSNNYVNEKQINKKRWKPIEDVPAIIFAKVGAAIMLNRKRLVYEKFFIDNNVMAYIFNDNWDVNFGQAIFNTLFLPRYAQVGALPSFNSSDIDTIEILIPVIEEQEKIGNFFKQLDETIELHEKKLETYQSLKKAMLQKMFV